MGKKKPRERTPKVRIARPAGRPFQLRYFCPNEQREIRVSVGCRDEHEAQHQKKELEAKLLLGIPAKKRERIRGPHMPWEEFREEYRDCQLVTLREKSAVDAESRLNIAERIIKPRALADMADEAALHRLQSRLLAGAESQYDPPRPRSPHTVKSHMRSVLAALGWGCTQKWLPHRPTVQLIKVGKLKHMKGRPITTEEFERMLDKTPEVVGAEAAPSWKSILWGLWESGLRVDEIMHVSWDIPNTIQPIWQKGRLPVLMIPEDMQKNATEEAIPLLPAFEAILLKTAEVTQSGWAFNPKSLQTKVKRRPRCGRLQSDWVSTVISRIGRAARVVVDPGNPAKEKPPKYASAHDLRRSCAERLLDAGVPAAHVQRVMRHASFETTRRHYAPGNVQKSAQVLREYLGTHGASPERRKPRNSDETRCEA